MNERTCKWNVYTKVIVIYLMFYLS